MLGELLALVDVLYKIRVQGQAVIDLVDTSCIQRHLLSQLTIDFVFYGTGQRCGALDHFHAKFEAIELPVQGQCRPDRSFLTCSLQLLVEIGGGGHRTH
jgi:hypothetical protein